MRQRLIILVGLPGSGKSTFYREKFSDLVLVSKDLMSPNTRRKDERQREQIVASLREGRSVVVDNTNPTREARAPLIALGKSLGAQIVGYYFSAGVKECIARNAGREGRARVPNVAIFAIAKKLEPPVVEEGFDELHVVSE